MISMATNSGNANAPTLGIDVLGIAPIPSHNCDIKE
jgi:hypothetical protein